MANPNQPNLGQTQQDIRDIASMTEDTFRSVADNIQSMFRDALEAGSNVSRSLGNDISNNLKALARQSNTALDNQEKLNRGVLKQSDIQKQIEARLSKINSIENQINASKLAGLDVDKQILEDLENTKKLNNVYINQLKEQKDLLDDIDKEIGQLGMGIKGLGTFAKKLGFDGLAKPLENAIQNTKAYKAQLVLANREYEALKNKSEELTDDEKERLQLLESEIKTLEKKQGRLRNIVASVKEELTITNMTDFVIGGIVKSFSEVDTMIGNTAKNMGISYSTSIDLNSSFTNMAANSGNVFITTKGINESFNQINQALGTNAELSADILVSQTELVKQAGYSVEAATMLSKLSIATGKPTKEIASSFLGQVKALNLINGTAVNEKQLLEDISNVSKDTLATFADQPGKLAEAAYEARKLGLDLEKLKGTQNALLDIESSIASEFEAEVITGKQLNLERARYFALTNDYAGLAKELGKQDITRASFGKMNVLQQEATAKALGMSADTMGGMLMDQEAMNKLSGINGDTAKERFDNLVKEVGLEEAKKRLGDEELANQMASASVQDRFTSSVEKLKEVFVAISTVLMPIFDGFANLVTWLSQSKIAMGAILGIATALVGIQAALAVKSLITAFASIFTGGFMAGPFGLPIALAGAAALGGLIGGVTSMAGDINSPANGKTQISTKEGGLFELSKNDDVVAFPGASKALSNPKIIKSPQQTVVQQSSPSIDYDKMAQALSKVQVNTNIDGVKVSNQLFNKPSAGMAIRKI